MRCLIVLAHPLPQCLNAHLAQAVHDALTDAGHDVQFLDLYREGFDPVLTPNERKAYYQDTFLDQAGLADIEMLVMVFPTWWFGLPAILKGWIDRSFLPGVAYDHASDLSALTPRLTNMKHALAITTLGAPGWVDRLILRRPVYRALKWGLIKACAPKAQFRMLSLYASETVETKRVAKFEAKIQAALTRMT
ncbi:NAD(P)H-dependent oxidoreductase [uncultured Shimia sp.]|uniref:NAD(P)H-dependent oxidoreductase n=1 Tax=uncultured Shimia sp. TaxID=573152 RepID=UPI0026338B40|nr:NAD(P)H-dependent oxidoreductase [uncultured Shimia sp.]